MSNPGPAGRPGGLRHDTQTYREILDQPNAWRQALAAVRDVWPGLQDRLAPEVAARELVLTGCGSSYYLALAAAAQLRLATGRSVAVVPASELLLHAPAALGGGRGYLLVALSRSGETTEVVRAAELARREHGAFVLAVSCYGQSSLGRLGDVTLALESGQESSVVMTKSYTSLLLGLQLLASRLGRQPLDDELDRLPDALDRLLPEYAAVAEAAGVRAAGKRIFLGSGPLYGPALEANLKMKEMAIVASEVYHTLEFRHGPISIVDDSTLVVCLMSEGGRAYEEPLLGELKALGATLFVVCERSSPAVAASADYLVELRSGLPDASRVPLYLPFAQLLAHACAVSRGEDPDHPRNLTQVVKLAS